MDKNSIQKGIYFLESLECGICHYPSMYTCTHNQLDISLIAGKVSDWLTVCNKLEQTLPTDPVLERWKERLTELHSDIPLLQQLCSKALRVRVGLVFQLDLSHPLES